MKLMQMLTLAVLGVAIAGGTIGCKKEEGPMEKVGKSIDEAAEKAADVAEDAADAAGDAAEEVEEAAEKAAE